jgi:hypothetical protein
MAFFVALTTHPYRSRLPASVPKICPRPRANASSRLDEVTRFRAAARVSDPDECEWEIYAYKGRLSSARFDPWIISTLGSADAQPGGFFFFAAAYDSVIWLIGRLGRSVANVLWNWPVSVIRASTADEWLVEAVSWIPHETAYVWVTSRWSRDQTVAEVSQALRSGDVPRPTNARLLETR